MQANCHYESLLNKGINETQEFIKFCEKAFSDNRKNLLPDYKKYKNITTTRVIMRYLKSASLSNEVVIRSGYRKIDKNSFAVDYRIINKKSNIILADAYFEYCL